MNIDLKGILSDTFNKLGSRLDMFRSGKFYDEGVKIVVDYNTRKEIKTKSEISASISIPVQRGQIVRIHDDAVNFVIDNVIIENGLYSSAILYRIPND